ncbi:MAG: alpha/beta hydrolase [Candidatus Bathyarchaeota archaeon]|nr:alpha/beta hydrolase [Candidatus Bathyarchaeota archaeon]
MQNTQTAKTQLKANSSQTVSLPEGRQLGYLSVGEGEPVVYFHGTASSRLELLLLKDLAYTYQFRLIGFDRPGYGLSTFAPRRKLSDINADINFLADHIELDKFAVLSWSGGGPFALAYASHFSERVTKMVVVGSPALPFDASKAHNNNPLARFAMKVPPVAMWVLRMIRNSVLNANQDIEAFLNSDRGRKMLAEWPSSDQKFFANPAWLKLMYGSMAEGFRQNNDSVKTVFQEHRLFMKPWDEPLWRIPRNKLAVWQGAEDRTCTVENAHNLVEAVAGAHLEVFSDEGHCVMFNKLDKLSLELRK